jgi:hypothetical protein
VDGRHAGVELRVDAAQAGRIELGQGGMFVPVQTMFPYLSEELHFRLTNVLPGVPVFEGRGVIRWVRSVAMEGLPAGIGVEFIHLGDGTREAAIDHILTRRPRAFVPIGREKR